ncbi:dihydrodipicolinate synthase family protein [Candidatus Pelagibacter sp. HIMB1695]|uniref:dihydrodipicolinate synthase family protein n=1 Tax=Candidatus Pelagibacter sp. HIMB1695 TaxID=3413364 RepID=UPI003F86AB10
MSLLKGIYAASMSVLNDDLTLNIDKTIEHSEMVIENGCHGAAIFGSTGQAQLIPVAEKIKLLNKISTNKYKDNFIIGTGLNSLGETINLMRVATSLNLENFLIMPPAFYKYSDEDVFNFYSKIVETIPNAKIVLYNFEKLCGYKFSVECVEKLAKNFPDQIVGVKDSSYNLFENLKIDNFSVMPGSESKLLKGLELGSSGIITATCNATSKLARKVYDDFKEGKEQEVNTKLCDVRETFEKYNLISGLHTFYKHKDSSYKNLLPPLRILNKDEESDLLSNLEKCNFSLKSSMAA